MHMYSRTVCAIKLPAVCICHGITFGRWTLSEHPTLFLEQVTAWTLKKCCHVPEVSGSQHKTWTSEEEFCDVKNHGLMKFSEHAQ